MTSRRPLVNVAGFPTELASGDTLALGAPFTVQAITATTAGQTTFTVTGGYTVGYILVVFKGVVLESTDYTATTGTTVVLSVGADEIGDVMQVVVFGTVQVANTRPSIYTLATLPDPTASANLYTTVFCTGLTGRGEEVFCDGMVWRRKSDLSPAN